MYSQELGAQLSLSPATITHHMAMLLWDGYVRVEKDGVRVKYQLCRKNLMAFLEQLPAALLENPPEHWIKNTGTGRCIQYRHFLWS